MRLGPRCRTLASVLLGMLCAAGCPTSPEQAAPDKAADSGPVKPVAAPLPDPAEELQRVVERAERMLSSADGDQIMELGRLLYEKGRPVNPAHPLMDRSRRLRRRIKERLVPTYMDMAEASFEAGRYDDAFRQIGYVPDSAPRELVQRKYRILSKKAGVLKRRKSCAKRWTLRACKLHEQHPDWSLKICKALYAEMLGLDMTPEMVRLSWGEPRRTERSEEKGKVQVVWYYDKGAFVVFDGPGDARLKVTEVQN